MEIYKSTCRKHGYEKCKVYKMSIKMYKNVYTKYIC